MKNFIAQKNLYACLILLSITNYIQTCLTAQRPRSRSSIPLKHDKDSIASKLLGCLRKYAATPTASLSTPKSFPFVEKPNLELHRKIHEDDYFGIEELLQNNTDPNTYNDLHVTALILAVRQKSYDITKLLLDYGANPNIQDKDPLWQCTALHWAVMIPDQHEILQLLLADPKTNHNIKDALGRTALDIATENYDTKSLQLFSANKPHNLQR